MFSEKYIRNPLEAASKVYMYYTNKLFNFDLAAANNSTKVRSTILGLEVDARSEVHTGVDVSLRALAATWSKHNYSKSWSPISIAIWKMVNLILIT